MKFICEYGGNSFTATSSSELYKKIVENVFNESLKSMCGKTFSLARKAETWSISASENDTLQDTNFTIKAVLV